MGTTLADDLKRFDKLATKFPNKPPGRGAGGTIKFAGTLWPAENLKGSSIKYHDVKYAIGEARAMAIKGYQVSEAALTGEESAIEQMTRWFGPRPVNPNPASARDWWVGVNRIIGVIEAFSTKNVSVYYRGDDTLVGQAGDYPGNLSPITPQDVRGYAESDTGTMDNIIGLCKLFFAKKSASGDAKMNLKGFDSVGGTLVHELSHNLCKTDDHETAAGADCYGTADCLGLVASHQRRAWYNADNIEYFCEEVLYGGAKLVIPVVKPEERAVVGVGALAGNFHPGALAGGRRREGACQSRSANRRVRSARKVQQISARASGRSRQSLSCGRVPSTSAQTSRGA